MPPRRDPVRRERQGTRDLSVEWLSAGLARWHQRRASGSFGVRGSFGVFDAILWPVICLPQWIEQVFWNRTAIEQTPHSKIQSRSPKEHHRRWNCHVPAFEAPQKIIRRGARSRLGPCCARLSSRAAWPSWLHSAAFHCENEPAASSNRPRGLLWAARSARWERDLSGCRGGVNCYVVVRQSPSAHSRVSDR